MEQVSFLKRHAKRILWNETGQMTVFVALIFQVLFVFFAMVINIGLLVHDKINLQNAVDFGAYYGAQRQAEILNEIAHINYQIHQDNKLLAWRYHVLGTLGRNRNGAVPAASGDAETFKANDAEGESPSVCVKNSFWLEATADSDEAENYCYHAYGPPDPISKIPSLVLTAPFIPGVIFGAAQIANLINIQKGALDNEGPANWIFTMQMMMAYKTAIATRKAVIEKLSTNLVSQDPRDQLNQSTKQGVFETIRKNLTQSNQSTFSQDNFTFTNGLATEACAGPLNDGGTTIVETRTSPLLWYTYSTSTDKTFEVGTAMMFDTSNFSDDPFVRSPDFGLLQPYSQENSTSLKNNSEAGLLTSSLGFEKNPWCMAYVGVSAKTTPRKPFAPFGQPVELVARSFAQPFGGRIGPWYKNQWPQNSPFSTGKRVDPLSTPRFMNDVTEDVSDARDLQPNYSRFPGDVIGVKSLAHQAGTRKFLRGYYGKDNNTGGQLSYNFFTNFGRIPATGDPLAFDTSNASATQVGPVEKNVRTAEEIAVAPDLFDATYYSIDLNYSANYKILNGNGQRFPDLGSAGGVARAVPPDLGGRNGASFDFTVKNQIEQANSNAGIDPILKSTLGYYLADIRHVLTAWAPNTNSDFSFPTARFGKCDHFANKPEYMIPGVCTNGGRVGYSVRIISRDHLLSPKWAVGGEGQVGPIKNPPSPDL